MLMKIVLDVIYYKSINARFNGLEGIVNAWFNHLETSFNRLDDKFETLTSKLG